MLQMFWLIYFSSFSPNAVNIYDIALCQEKIIRPEATTNNANIESTKPTIPISYIVRNQSQGSEISELTNDVCYDLISAVVQTDHSVNVDGHSVNVDDHSVNVDDGSVITWDSTNYSDYYLSIANANPNGETEKEFKWFQNMNDDDK